MDGVKAGEARECHFQQIIAKIQKRIAGVEISARLFFYIGSLVEVFCEQHGVIQINIGHHVILAVCYHRLQRKHISRLPVHKKVRFPHRTEQKHIIIKIDKLLRNARYSVKI